MLNITATILLCLISNTLCTDKNPDLPVIISVPQNECAITAQQMIAISYPKYRIVKIMCDKG